MKLKDYIKAELQSICKKMKISEFYFSVFVKGIEKSV